MSTKKMAVQVLPPDICRGDEPIIGARVQLFNHRLRQRRIAMGYTQYALSETLGLGRQAITFIESLRRIPTTEQMEMIATALLSEASYLFPEEIRALKKSASPAFYLNRDGGLSEIERIDESTRVRETIARVHLTANEMRVLDLRFGRYGLVPHTLDACAATMKLSSGRIRQIEMSALEKLRRDPRVQKLSPA